MEMVKRMTCFRVQDQFKGSLGSSLGCGTLQWMVSNWMRWSRRRREGSYRYVRPSRVVFRLASASAPAAWASSTKSPPPSSSEAIMVESSEAAFCSTSIASLSASFGWEAIRSSGTAAFSSSASLGGSSAISRARTHSRRRGNEQAKIPLGEARAKNRSGTKVLDCILIAFPTCYCRAGTSIRHPRASPPLGALWRCSIPVQSKGGSRDPDRPSEAV